MMLPATASPPQALPALLHIFFHHWKPQVFLQVFIPAAENVKRKCSFPTHIRKLHAWNQQADKRETSQIFHQEFGSFAQSSTSWLTTSPHYLQDKELHTKQIALLLEVKTGRFPRLLPRWQECLFMPCSLTCLWDELKGKEHQGITGGGPEQSWLDNWLKKRLKCNMLNSQDILSRQFRKRRKQVKRRKFLAPLTCHSLGKTETVFQFDILRMDICGLCLPSILPALLLVLSLRFSSGDHSSPTLRPCGSGVKAPRWSPTSQVTEVGLRHHSGQSVYSIPLTPVTSSRMGMGPKWITWDSGIWEGGWAGRHT